MTSVLLLRKEDPWGATATEMVRAFFPQARATADRLAAEDPGAALLISYQYGHVVPAAVLSRCGTALNFHPGSRSYPGTGCYNFALYEEAAEYGCVCHHMEATVDTGALVAERVFPLLSTDTVASLKLRTSVEMLGLLHRILLVLHAGQPLPRLDAGWTRPPFRRSQLEALCELTPDMPADEVRRRVRAVTYPNYPGARMVVHGMRFDARPDGTP